MADVDRIPVVCGERVEVARTLQFTFWTDDAQSSFLTIASNKERVLLEGHLLRADPGLQAKVGEIGVNLHWFESSQNRPRWPQYEISANLEVNPGPNCPPGPADLELEFPTVLTAARQTHAVSPISATLKVPFEVFASRAAVLRAHGPTLVLGILFLIAFYAALCRGCRELMDPRARMPFQLRVTMIMASMVLAAAAGLVTQVATLMHWLTSVGAVAALIAVVVTNAAMGGAVWLAGFKKPRAGECIVALVGLGVVATAMIMYPRARALSGVTLDLTEVELTVAALAPALAWLLAEAPVTRAQAFVRSEEARPPDPVPDAGVLAELGLDAPRDLAPDVAEPFARCRDDLARALLLTRDRRPDEAVAILERVVPTLDALPASEQAALRGAAALAHGAAFEQVNMPEQALEAYQRALTHVPALHAARAALRRLESRAS